MMNSQEQFDTVVRNLGKQGKPATDANGYCVYRAPDGSKCAAGQLIPDDVYRYGMEGIGIGSVIEENPDLQWLDKPLVRSLQSAHDIWASDQDMVKFVARLHSIASQFELNPAVITEAFPGL